MKISSKDAIILAALIEQLELQPGGYANLNDDEIRLIIAFMDSRLQSDSSPSEAHLTGLIVESIRDILSRIVKEVKANELAKQRSSSRILAAYPRGEI